MSIFKMSNPAYKIWELKNIEATNVHDSTVKKEKIMEKSEFLEMTPTEFIQKTNIEPLYYENIRPYLDMLSFQQVLVPSIHGGYWRRAIEGEKFKDFSGDIDMFFCNTFKDTIPLDRKRVAQFFYNQFNDENFVVSHFDDTKNTLVKLKNFCGIDTTAQIMGSYFGFGGKSRKNANTNGLASMDSYVNMIAYDFYSDLFYVHKDTLECIKNKHYKVNPYASRSNRIFTINMIPRIIKFTKMGYELTEDDVNLAYKHIQDNINKEDSYKTNTVDIIEHKKEDILF
jgi:hypothetical protein